MRIDLTEHAWMLPAALCIVSFAGAVSLGIHLAFPDRIDFHPRTPKATEWTLAIGQELRWRGDLDVHSTMASGGSATVLQQMAISGMTGDWNNAQRPAWQIMSGTSSNCISGGSGWPENTCSGGGGTTGVLMASPRPRLPRYRGWLELSKLDRKWDGLLVRCGDCLTPPSEKPIPCRRAAAGESGGATAVKSERGWICYDWK